MRYKKSKLIVVFLLGLGLIGLQAQESINASGGNASGSGGSASYSVGQVFYHTNSGTNEFSVAEGVQQAFEISIVTGIDDAAGIELEYLVYPNPTRDNLTLKVQNNYKNDKLIYQLYNMNGVLLESKKLMGDKTAISMAGYVRATYFLKIVDSNNEIKVFKIIKH